MDAADSKNSPISPAKQKQTSGFLMSIVRTLSTSADFEQREKEKARIEKAFRECDVRLGQLVREHYSDLTKISHDFSNISSRINESREKIKKIKDDLSSCKTLLHCKRDELRRLWIDGVEQKTIASLLDQVEQIKDVPEKLNSFLTSKHYLHATDLVVNAVAKLEGNLAGVEALKDLKAEIIFRKEQMHENLIKELNRQIYMKSSAPSASRSGSGRKGEMLLKQTESAASVNKGGMGGGGGRVPLPQMLGQQSSSLLTVNTRLTEDLTRDPEEDSNKFVAILVESLFILKKVPEAAEALKLQIHPELIAIVARASNEVVENTCGQGDALANANQPHHLLELLEMVFYQFRGVAHMHSIVLSNLQRIISKGRTSSSLTGRENIVSAQTFGLSASRTIEHKQTQGLLQENSGLHIKSEYMYDMKDVWSKIQGVLQLLLSEYLDVQNTEKSRHHAPASFDEPNVDIGLYFSKKKQQKNKKLSLFRFDASIHALSTNSYVEDTRQFSHSSLFGDSSTVGMPKHQLVCKPSVDNIKAIFKPLQNFIMEIEMATECSPGSSSLQEFLKEFIENIFLGQVHFTVSNNINLATKGFDSLRNVIDHKTQKELGVPRPLLQSTVTVDRSIMELRELMRDLPDYAEQFLNMICNVLRGYMDTCLSAYKGIVQYDTDEKRIISAMWAKDEDISRFLRSLPSWRTLQPTDGQELNRTVCSEEEMRALNSKEAIILIANLSTDEAFIPQHEIITDVTQMRTVANVHESLEWFSNRLKNFAITLAAKSSQVMIPEVVLLDIPPVSQKTIDSLNTLVKDFKDLAEICLLLLHLEVRVHCFYYLMPVAKQANFAGPIDDLDPDSNVLKLNKDLSSMEEVLSQSLQPKRFKYIFESLGFVVSSILVNSLQYIKKINENGIKKMCRNIFAIQQNLTNITMSRESDLDHARQYYELLYMNPDDILTSIAEKGPQFAENEYAQLLLLHHRSHGDPTQLDQRMQKLTEIIDKCQDETKS